MKVLGKKSEHKRKEKYRLLANGISDLKEYN